MRPPRALCDRTPLPPSACALGAIRVFIGVSVLCWSSALLVVFCGLWVWRRWDVDARRLQCALGLWATALGLGGAALAAAGAALAARAGRGAGDADGARGGERCPAAIASALRAAQRGARALDELLPCSVLRVARAPRVRRRRRAPRAPESASEDQRAGAARARLRGAAAAGGGRDGWAGERAGDEREGDVDELTVPVSPSSLSRAPAPAPPRTLASLPARLPQLLRRQAAQWRSDARSADALFTGFCALAFSAGIACPASTIAFEKGWPGGLTEARTYLGTALAAAGALAAVCGDAVLRSGIGAEVMAARAAAEREAAAKKRGGSEGDGDDEDSGAEARGAARLGAAREEEDEVEVVSRGGGSLSTLRLAVQPLLACGLTALFFLTLHRERNGPALHLSPFDTHG